MASVILEKCDNALASPNDALENYKPRLSPEKEKRLFEKLALSGMATWPENVQEEVRELIKEYRSLFTQDDLDLGKMAVVKHHITLTDYTPFKQRYRHIPPHQYDEV